MFLSFVLFFSKKKYFLCVWIASSGRSLRCCCRLCCYLSSWHDCTLMNASRDLFEALTFYPDLVALLLFSLVFHDISAINLHTKIGDLFELTKCIEYCCIIFSCSDVSIWSLTLKKLIQPLGQACTGSNVKTKIYCFVFCSFRWPVHNYEDLRLKWFILFYWGMILRVKRLNLCCIKFTCAAQSTMVNNLPHLLFQ